VPCDPIPGEGESRWFYICQPSRSRIDDYLVRELDQWLSSLKSHAPLYYTELSICVRMGTLSSHLSLSPYKGRFGLFAQGYRSWGHAEEYSIRRTHPYSLERAGYNKERAPVGLDNKGIPLHPLTLYIPPTRESSPLQAGKSLDRKAWSLDRKEGRPRIEYKWHTTGWSLSFLLLRAQRIS